MPVTATAAYSPQLPRPTSACALAFHSRLRCCVPCGCHEPDTGRSSFCQPRRIITMPNFRPLRRSRPCQLSVKFAVRLSHQFDRTHRSCWHLSLLSNVTEPLPSNRSFAVKLRHNFSICQDPSVPLPFLSSLTVNPSVKMAFLCPIETPNFTGLIDRSCCHLVNILHASLSARVAGPGLGRVDTRSPQAVLPFSFQPRSGPHG